MTHAGKVQRKTVNLLLLIFIEECLCPMDLSVKSVRSAYFLFFFSIAKMAGEEDFLNAQSSTRSAAEEKKRRFRYTPADDNLLIELVGDHHIFSKGVSEGGKVASWKLLTETFLAARKKAGMKDLPG